MDAPFSAMIVVLWFCLIICISLFGLGKCLLSVHVFLKQSFYNGDLIGFAKSTCHKM